MNLFNKLFKKQKEIIKENKVKELLQKAESLKSNPDIVSNRQLSEIKGSLHTKATQQQIDALERKLQKIEQKKKK